MAGAVAGRAGVAGVGVRAVNRPVKPHWTEDARLDDRQAYGLIDAMLNPKVAHVAIPSIESRIRNKGLIAALHNRGVERERYDPKTGAYSHSYPKGAATIRKAFDDRVAARQAAKEAWLAGEV